MTSKKRILFQAAVASVGLAVVGVTVNTLNLTASAPYESELVADHVRITTESRPAAPTDVRVLEEGEYIPEWREEAERAAAAPRYTPGSEPPGADGVMGEVDSLAYMEPPLPRTGSGISRSEAMVRVEQINEELQQDLFPDHRAELEREKLNLLVEHFPTAAGEEVAVAEPPVEEFGEPKNGDHILADLDINNVFNKAWGLLQGIVLAWVGVKLGQRKREKAKEDFLTNSVMDRIDEKLVAKYRTDKIKGRKK